MKPYKHCQISVKTWGGKPDDYLKIHNWFDQTKNNIPDVRHRMVLHNSLGIFLCEQVFGVYFTNSDDKIVQVRDVGEQHVLDDLGFIPTLEKCFEGLSIDQWMGGAIKSKKVYSVEQIEERINNFLDKNSKENTNREKSSQQIFLDGASKNRSKTYFD